jgi:hypothetical protein
MTSLLKCFCVLTLTTLFSCGSSAIETDAAARVFDQYLSRKEVAKQIPFGTSSRDSALLAREIIDQWVRQQLIFKRAENNLTDEQKDVKKQLEDYRISLLTFAYERELVRQKLDTVVSDAEIEAYYRANPGNFELKNNIIRLKYIKLPVSSPNGDKASKWFRSSTTADRSRLEQYCKMYAVNYLLDDANWLLFDDVLKELPIQNYSMERFNRGERSLDLKDNEYRYLVSITGFLIEETNAPLSFEKNNIRNIILNKRKIKLVEQMQKDVYNEAMNNNDVEIFAPAP